MHLSENLEGQYTNNNNKIQVLIIPMLEQETINKFNNIFKCGNVEILNNGCVYFHHHQQ